MNLNIIGAAGLGLFLGIFCLWSFVKYFEAKVDQADKEKESMICLNHEVWSEK